MTCYPDPITPPLPAILNALQVAEHLRGNAVYASPQDTVEINRLSGILVYLNMAAAAASEQRAVADGVCCK